MIMARLTIRLSDDRQQALKETAALSGKTIGAIIEESLDAYGIKTRKRAEQIVAQARCRAAMEENEATELANREVRSARRGE